jgi:hypothetical protein
LPNVTVYTGGSYANIDQLPLQRDWMDLTFDRHAYHCFPVSLSNRLGWGISYPEDIVFIGTALMIAPEIMLRFCLEKNMHILAEETGPSASIQT